MRKWSKKLKQEWIAALRSGDYAQGKGRLHIRQGRSHRYCCLGVLCEVAGIKGKIYAKEPWRVYSYAGDAYCAPKKLLSQTNQGPLQVQNDGGDSFAKIADWIEVNL